jgi:hypothetical protein
MSFAPYTLEEVFHPAYAALSRRMVIIRLKVILEEE